MESVIYTANQTSTEVADGGAVPLGTTVRLSGCNLRQAGDGIRVRGGGYYSVNVSVTLAPAAAGTAVVTLLKDGVAVQGARAAATTSAAAESVTLAFPAVVRVPGCSCDNGASLTLALTGAAATVTNVAVEVRR